MLISNNKPRDHHYIPAFYLKQWAGANRKVIEYSRKHGNFLKKSVGPKATGFQTDLYAFPELPEDMAQHIEDVFLRYADNAASDALNKHLSGDQQWTGELRSAWSRFIVSLLLRHPDVMAELREATMKSWERAGPNSQRRYEATKESHFPATFDEYIAAIDPLIPVKVSMNAIIKAIDNVQIGTQINGMFWGVVDISKGPHRFLTSDRPLQYAFMREPRGFMSLPISPTKLFIASNNNGGVANVRRLRPQEVARQVNIWSVARARRFVIADADSQEAFIKKHIGTKMEPSPLFPSISA
jgi:Protein of unknown function (DUF4238)